MTRSRLINGAVIVIGILSCAALGFSWLLILALWNGLHGSTTPAIEWAMVAAVAAMLLCLAVLVLRAIRGGLPGWLVLPTGLVGLALLGYGVFFVASEPYDWPLYVPAVTLGASLIFVAKQAFQIKRGSV